MKYLVILFLVGGLAVRLIADPLPPGDTDFGFEPAVMVLTHELANAERLEIYEGLPKGQAISDRQKQSTAYREIAGQWFYSAAEDLRFKHIMKLQRLVDGGLFQPLREGKLCGGFHADFAVAFTNPKSTFYVLFCFGCHEARIIREGNLFAAELKTADFQVTTDLSDKSFEELRSLLMGYHKPERDGGPAGS